MSSHPPTSPSSTSAPSGSRAKSTNSGGIRCFLAHSLGLLVGLGIGISLLFSGVGGSGAEAPTIVAEYQLKAAFLPKFPLFVVWPEDAFASHQNSFTIGVLGDNPFGPHLENAIRGKLVGTRPLVLRPCATLEAATNCQILFIGSRDPKNLVSTLHALAGKRILTVSDTPGFAELGGMVNLASQGQRVHLEVNLEQIQAAQLRMDPQLLQRATIVKSTKASPPL